MKYQFLEFELDVDSFQLLRHGRRVELGPKSLDLLVYLIRHRDRLVDRSELHQVVWRGSPIGASTIPTALAEVRKALRDEARAPTAIQTVYGKGYRFIASVREITQRRRQAGQADSYETSGFIGRSEELQALAGFVQQGAPHGAAFIVGAPGIGKSWLLREFAARLQRRKMLVLRGHCSEVPGAPPFAPWKRLIGQLAEDRDSKAAARLVGVLEEGSTRDPLSFDAASAVRSEFFGEVGRLLARWGESEPVVVLLDDLHRGDEASLLLLAFLVREYVPQHVCFVGTLRPSVTGDRRRSEILGQCLHDASMPAIELQPFSKKEARQFLNLNSGLDISEELFRRMYERTSGNPFFMAHLLRRLEGQSSLAHRSGGDDRGGLGQLARDAIVAELGALDDLARRLLETAAVVGKEVPVFLLQEAAKLDREAVLEGLRIPLRDGIVEEADDPGTLRFSHLIVRDAIYESIVPSDRARIHRGIVDALVKVQGPIVGEVACAAVRHVRMSMERSDLAEMMAYSLEAARWSARIYGFEEAVSYLREAIQTGRLYGIDSATYCDLLIRLMIAERQSGERELARETCRRAAEVARTIPSPALLARSALSYAPGFFAVEAGVVDDFLIGALDEAQDALVGAGEEAIRARVLGRLAVALCWSERDRDREMFAEEAIRVAQGARDPQLLVEVRAAREVALWGPEGASERAQLAGKAVAQAKVNGDSEMELVCRLYRLTNLLQIGAFEEVDTEVETFSQRAEVSLEPGALWYRDLFRAVRAMMRGDWDCAEALADQFVAQGRKMGDRNAENCGVTHRAYRALECGEPKEAFEIIDSQMHRYPRVRSYRCGRIYIASMTGRVEEARAEFRSLAESGFERIPKTVEWLIQMALLAEACVELGERRRATELYDLLLPHADEFVVVIYSVAVWRPVSYFLGRLAGLVGLGEEAEGHFEKAVGKSRELGAFPWVAHAEFRYSEMLRDRGRPGDRIRARGMVLSAEDIARRLGMRPLLSAIQRYLEDERRSGLR